MSELGYRWTRRAIALQSAMNRAQDPEFKILWQRKLDELILMARQEREGDESI
jgi:hypothetical protein